MAPPSRTPRRNPSCSGPPPRPARRSRRKPRSGKKPSEKEPTFLDPSLQHGRTAASSFTLATSAFSCKPGAVSIGAAVSSRRNAAAAPPAREGAGESVRFWGGGRTKKQHGLRCDARVLRTSPVGRGGGGRQAGQEHSDGEQGDDGRTNHPARRGGLADAAANTRKAREEMEEEQEPGLSAPKPSLPSAAELVSPVWWGDCRGLKRKPGGASRRGLAAAGFSSYP